MLDRQLDALYKALGSGAGPTYTSHKAAQYVFPTGPSGSRVSRALHKSKVALGYEAPTLREKLSGYGQDLADSASGLSHRAKVKMGYEEPTLKEKFTAYSHGLADSASDWYESGTEMLHPSRRVGLWGRLKESVGA